MTNEVIEEGADRYNVPALERGLRVLCEFSRENRTLSAPELSRRFDLPRSTVFRLLTTLENMGFVEKTEGGRDYRLGLAVLRLGFEYLASLELTQLGTPLLQRLSEELHTPCNLVVRDGRSIVYVAKVSPPSVFMSAVTVGTRLPAHATVLGRVLLEDLTLVQLRALFPEDKLETFSPSTPKTVNELFDMVQADRQRGYVLGEGFFESNISSIAAPVRDHSGHIVAALGTTITADHIEASQIDAMVQRVRDTADAISGLLNYSPSGKVVALRGGERA
ncbi:IclR family transcriptional regulator [Variovorax sp. J22R133]|uniref:IclR family transcriptional regulator n=1 Tax=Variovorax brevis TaxID=3053503 RepID=UPI002575B479|nr:IclR family transcriptional regulator [Variovorax sp. J22R133]MDM0115166.1 IclR family transcriptional regulator [Variovorax sp. J22R133]